MFSAWAVDPSENQTNTAEVVVTAENAEVVVTAENAEVVVTAENADLVVTPETEVVAETPAAPSDTGAEEVLATEVEETPAVEEEKKCDEFCYDTCALDNDADECAKACDCDVEVQKQRVQLTKNERCWGTCRQSCVLEMLTKSDSDTGSEPKGDCFGSCSCICNQGCTNSCEKSPMKGFCLQSCGCPKNETISDELLEQSEMYFKLPLDPRDSNDIAADFQTKLTIAVSSSFNKDAFKEQKLLNKKLQHIEHKWDEYVRNANKLGVDPLVFCDQTCSHDCFLEADKSTYDILTSCLISKCECFNPKLPKAHDNVSFEALIALKNIINSEEDATILPMKVVSDNTTLLSEQVVENSVVPKAAVSTIADDMEAQSKLTSIQSLSEIGDDAAETGEKAKDTAEDAGEIVKEKSEEAKETSETVVEEATDKIKEIVEAGKQKIKDMTDKFTGDDKDKVDIVENPVVIEDKECNLTCFRECLDLKKFVPYPVIQQCIQIRCECTLDSSSSKLESLIQLNSLDSLTSPEIQKEQPSVLLNFLLSMFILSIMIGAAILLFTFIADKESRRKRKNSDAGMYNDGLMYERLT